MILSKDKQKYLSISLFSVFCKTPKNYLVLDMFCVYIFYVGLPLLSCDMKKDVWTKVLHNTAYRIKPTRVNHKWAEYSTQIHKICKTVCQTIYIHMQAGQVVAVPHLISGTMTCT